MKPSEYMKTEGICVGLSLQDQSSVMEVLAALQQKCGATTRYKTLRREVAANEEASPSAIGAGVSIAVVRSDVMKQTAVSAVTLTQGVDYNAPDGILTKLAFLVAMPPDTESDLASRLSVLLMDENLREQLMSAADEETFLDLLQLAEEGNYGSNEQEQEIPLIIAVMDAKNEDARRAAAVLQQTAGRMGKLLRVEFYEKGAESDVLSPEEIQDAAGILLMAGIRPDRFDGKPLLRAGITDGIYRPEHLLNQAAKAPVFRRNIMKKGKSFSQKIGLRFRKK